jgi:hypothetical protein
MKNRMVKLPSALRPICPSKYLFFTALATCFAMAVCWSLLAASAMATPDRPVSFVRGVLLVGKFRTQAALNSMSGEDQRNTLISELAARTRDNTGLVKAEWFKRYRENELPERFDRIVQSWDTANKKDS